MSSRIPLEKDAPSGVAIWRAHHGVSLRELSEKLGVTHQAVMQMERRNDHQIGSLLNVARALGAKALRVTLICKDGTELPLEYVAKGKPKLRPKKKGFAVTKAHAKKVT